MNSKGPVGSGPRGVPGRPYTLAASGGWRSGSGLRGWLGQLRAGRDRGHGNGTGNGNDQPWLGQPGEHGHAPGWAGPVLTGPVPTGPAEEHVPVLLRRVAAWSWRIILVGIVVYFAFRITMALRLLVLPLIAGLLITALLQPLTSWLRHRGLHSLAATWLTLLAAIIVVAGVVTLITTQIQAEYPQLAAQVQRTIHELQVYLSGPPFRLKGLNLQQLSKKAVTYLSQHKTLIAGTVLTGGQIFFEMLTALVLTVFITFFLLKDGAKIWTWLISGLSPDARTRAGQAGKAAWNVLVSYMRGTTAVAAIHAIVIGTALWILGTPLLTPLVILVFLAAYVPLIGILVVGALAITITLATKGWVAALILLGVLLLENQLEGHLLQPLVVGRAVRLHPLAIIVVLTVGGIVAGIAGAIVAVPTAAVITFSWPYLRGAGVVPMVANGAPPGAGHEPGNRAEEHQ